MKATYHAVPVIVYARMKEGHAQADTYSNIQNALTNVGLSVLHAEDFDDAILPVKAGHVLSGNITKTCPPTEWKMNQEPSAGLGIVRLLLSLLLIYVLIALTYVGWLIVTS